MELPNLKHDYYDALIREARLGPRRELSLSLELSDEAQGGERKAVTIRFGGITNFDEVSLFFEHFESSPSRWEGLHFLRYSAERTSKPNNLLIEMQFDRTDDEVCVGCRNVSVSD